MLPLRQMALMTFLFSCLAGRAFAQVVATAPAASGEAQSVSGAGSVTISRAPEVMRLQVTLLGRGSTLKDALAALKDRVTKAKPQLVTLRADKDSIKVEDSRIAELKGERHQQLQMLMLERARQGGKTSKAKAATNPPVIVSAVLTAEWKLTAKTSDELLLAIHPVQEKIKAADLAGTKDIEKLTPEQEELLEEAQDQFSFGQSDEPKPGEPEFLFVSRISEADMDKALAEAFAKAKAKAARLAKAAGAELRGLTLLQDSIDNATPAGAGILGYDVLAHRLNQRFISMDQQENEAVGIEPGAVKKQITVQATFTLQTKK